MELAGLFSASSKSSSGGHLSRLGVCMTGFQEWLDIRPPLGFPLWKPALPCSDTVATTDTMWQFERPSNVNSHGVGPEPPQDRDGQQWLHSPSVPVPTCMGAVVHLALTGVSALISAAGTDKCGRVHQVQSQLSVCVCRKQAGGLWAESNNHKHSADQPPHLDPICLSSVMPEPNVKSSMSNAASEGWRHSLSSVFRAKLCFLCR